MIPRYAVSFNTGDLPSLECDVLIVGSGVAGLSTALRLSRFCRVLLVTKAELQVSATRRAQGGIAVVLSGDDSPEYHIEDTLVAGAGLSDLEATTVLVEEGPDCVRELLDEYHADFDMRGGELDLATEGGHSHARVVHARGDATGSEVESALGRALMSERRAELLEHTFLVDLLISEGRCRGGILLDVLRQTLMVVWARAVVLASGGMGELYLVTTNPPVCTGDGVAIAFRAGAKVSDVEFVQFHPTALHIPEEPKFLISEALRGEGAHLVDLEGNRIMEGLHPLAELAPRDIVVARMVEVMKEQETNHLYLDARHLDPDELIERFPNIYEHCLQAGIDMTRSPIPVSPAAHYMSGGVVTDLQGETDIPGLFACGETACTGVHGANRLASNSLLEGLVFARRISRTLESSMPSRPPAGEKPFESSLKPAGPWIKEDLLRGNLRELMRDSVGMLRFSKELTQVIEFLTDNADVLEMEYASMRGIELKNMFTLALLVTTSALVRQESRGCHRRRDYPELDDWNWRKHIDLWLEDREIRMATRPQRTRPQTELRLP